MMGMVLGLFLLNARRNTCRNRPFEDLLRDFLMLPARYLKKLDSSAKSISDWRNIANHTVYMEDLRQKHGRKKSFWSRYDA